MVHSFWWCVSLWGEGRVQIRAIITLGDFFALSVALETTQGMEEPKPYRAGSSLSPMVRLEYKRDGSWLLKSVRLFREEMQMLAEAQALWEQFEHVNNEIFKWSDGLTDDQLNWKPSGKDTNSIGILMSHIMGIEIFSVAERVGGQSVNRDRSVRVRQSGDA